MQQQGSRELARDGERKHHPPVQAGSMGGQSFAPQTSVIPAPSRVLHEFEPVAIHPFEELHDREEERQR
jgi:hypothetical protein